MICKLKWATQYKVCIHLCSSNATEPNLDVKLHDGIHVPVIDLTKDITLDDNERSGGKFNLDSDAFTYIIT